MMTDELFKNLPSEITIKILSKLPLRAVLICKCVCKSWLQFVETDEFVQLHLSASGPGLVTFHVGLLSRKFKFFEFEDGRDVQHHDLHYNLLTEFNFPYAEWMCGSVDGLLWLRERNTDAETEAIYVCNPITRDYIRIRSPPEFPYTSNQVVTYGFGSCKMTGRYKVVRFLLNRIYDKETHYPHMVSVSECHVYTLGTGFGWRRLASCALHFVTPKKDTPGAFVNGNLHWLGYDSNRCLWITCFDLETESFSTFSTPPLASAQSPYEFELFAFGGTLCLRDSTSEGEIVVWLMEEYGVAESWTKKVEVKQDHGDYYVFTLHLIKWFKDGDLLMGVNDSRLFYYSNETNVIQQVDMFRIDGSIRDTVEAISHIPSFLSLKSFGMENVSSF